MVVKTAARGVRGVDPKLLEGVEDLMHDYRGPVDRGILEKKADVLGRNSELASQVGVDERRLWGAVSAIADVERKLEKPRFWRTSVREGSSGKDTVTWDYRAGCLIKQIRRGSNTVNSSRI